MRDLVGAVVLASVFAFSGCEAVECIEGKDLREVAQLEHRSAWAALCLGAVAAACVLGAKRMP